MRPGHGPDGLIPYRLAKINQIQHTMKTLSEKAMRAYLNKVDAIKKKYAFSVETIEVNVRKTNDDYSGVIRSIHVYVYDRNEGHLFDIYDFHSVAENNAALERLESTLQGV